MSSLPSLQPEESAQTERVAAVLRERLAAAGGWLSFEHFMNLVLYEPGLGYYSAGAHKLGAGGDFVTAPEISEFFGRAMARQVAEIMAASRIDVVTEIGPGTGALAADCLLELQALDCLPRRYQLLEVSADLRERQRRTLARRAPQLLTRVAWLSGPSAETGQILLANEVLDALPVLRIRRGASVWEELGVELGDGGFRWAGRPLSASLQALLRARLPGEGEGYPPGFTTEICRLLDPWLARILEPVDRGVALFVDYGMSARDYYRPDRGQGTLMCHFRHRAHDDPLRYPGLQDITAWVDFTAAARAAAAAGWETAGFTTQAHFLLGTGIEAMLAEQPGADLQQSLARGRALQTLLLPGEMGERFKALALTRDYHGPLSAFQIRDFSEVLRPPRAAPV